MPISAGPRLHLIDPSSTEHNDACFVYHKKRCWYTIAASINVSKNKSSRKVAVGNNERFYEVLMRITLLPLPVALLCVTRSHEMYIWWYLQLQRLITSLPSVRVRSIASSVSVCLSVCLPVRSYISKPTCPNFTKFSVRVTFGRGLILLWRQCNTYICISVLWITSWFHIIER